jgi:hypothetical protein
VDLKTIPKNPYWIENGIMISDPDGFNIIFSIEQGAKSYEQRARSWEQLGFRI